MLIEQIPCPRCGIARTVRVRKALSMCWNCKLQWSPEGNVLATGPTAPTPGYEDAYAFTPSELSRLAHYRAAVAAGFYTEILQDER